MTDEPDSRTPPSPYHPEEIKADFDLRVGKSISLRGSARCTPAGVIAAGITASIILLAVGVLVRATLTKRAP